MIEYAPFAEKVIFPSPKSPLYARIAQLVEQRIENPRVGGSNPPPGTIKINNLADN
jgi:hypothetical protein